MSRFIPVFVLASAAVAAPVPPEAADAERVRKGFGAPVDPDKDRTFAFYPAGLKLTAPAASHKFGGPKPGNVPRTERRVSGDFVARVAVAVPDPPAGADRAFRSRYAGGLLLFAPDGGRVFLGRLKRTGQPGGMEWSDQAIAEYEFPAKPGDDEGLYACTREPPAGEWCHLRLTRKGDRLTAEFGPDGLTWTKLGPEQTSLPLPKELTVGVAVPNTTGKPVAVRFEGFAVEPVE
ncbi:MAG: hypothetical protein C0501_25030 [Isosphaera sp.]|nr:hypothetical protein [Isosphaera sp.]